MEVQEDAPGIEREAESVSPLVKSISTGSSCSGCLSVLIPTLRICKEHETRKIDFTLWTDGFGAIAKTTPGRTSLDFTFRDWPDDVLLIKGIISVLMLILNELMKEDHPVNKS